MKPRPRALWVQFPCVLPAPEQCFLDDILRCLHVTIDEREHESHQRQAVGAHPGVRAAVTTRSSHDRTTPPAANTFISRLERAPRGAMTWCSPALRVNGESG